LRHGRGESVQGFGIAADFGETVLEKRHCGRCFIRGGCRQRKTQRAVAAWRDFGAVHVLVQPVRKPAQTLSDEDRVRELSERSTGRRRLCTFGLAPAKRLLKRKPLVHSLRGAERRIECLQMVREGRPCALINQAAGFLRVRIKARHGVQDESVVVDHRGGVAGAGMDRVDDGGRTKEREWLSNVPPAGAKMRERRLACGGGARKKWPRGRGEGGGRGPGALIARVKWGGSSSDQCSCDPS